MRRKNEEGFFTHQESSKQKRIFWKYNRRNI